MQHPGRVSFKFIDKMQLVSSFLLGTRGQRGQGPGLAGAQRGSPHPQCPLSCPPLQEGPILPGWVAFESHLGL